MYKDIFESIRNEAEKRNLRERTIQLYCSDVSYFLRWIGKNVSDINLLHASGMYEKQTVCIDESILPEDTTFGVRISGDSMESEFHDGQIAWVLQQESVANGEIGIFALNGEAYIKKLQVLFIGHIILHN